MEIGVSIICQYIIIFPGMLLYPFIQAHNSHMDHAHEVSAASGWAIMERREIVTSRKSAEKHLSTYVGNDGHPLWITARKPILVDITCMNDSRNNILWHTKVSWKPWMFRTWTFINKLAQQPFPANLFMLKALEIASEPHKHNTNGKEFRTSWFTVCEGECSLCFCFFNDNKQTFKACPLIYFYLMSNNKNLQHHSNCIIWQEQGMTANQIFT